MQIFLDNKSCATIIIHNKFLMFFKLVDGPIFDVMSVDARCEMENLQAVTCYVMLGSDINIDCTFESFPEAVGEIGELEARLNTSNVEVEDTSIIIEGVTEENLGVYRCMASNEVAGQQVTRTITIEVANGGIILCACSYT